MMIMTAKLDPKKGIAILIVAALAAICLVLLLGGGGEEVPTAATVSAASNDGRVQFLTRLGWKVTPAPVETSRVRIPEADDPVFARYNALQQSLGYDLAAYSGKTVLRCVYQIENYPDTKEPVYATILVSNDRIIGGDITDTSPQGCVRGLQQAPDTAVETVPSAPE